MSDKPDNPPAFPTTERFSTPEGDVQVESIEGMTLRDYFAGQVLAGQIPYSKLVSEGNDVSRVAYDVADAMLEERGKHE